MLLSLPLFAGAMLLPNLACAADGLGPGYAMIGWLILIVFIIGFLAIVGVVVLIAWLLFRRRSQQRSAA
jgi:hypothetical protein